MSFEVQQVQCYKCYIWLALDDTTTILNELKFENNTTVNYHSCYPSCPVVCDYCGNLSNLCSKVTKGIDEHGHPIEYDICLECIEE